MQTEIITPQELFSPERRMEAPLFQRPYVWNEEDQWAPLWEDIRALAEAGLEGAPASEHFLGAVVLQTRETGLTELPARTIIDGQQRLTTLSLALDALGDVFEELGLASQARRARRLTRNDLDEDAQPEDRYKVWPTNHDRAAFSAVMEAEDPAALPEAVRASRLRWAHDYFQRTFTEWIGPADSEEIAARAGALYAAITQGLRMVVISLSAADDAQAIFETLNARGTPLTAMDLVKNFLFQGLDPHAATTQALYDRYWAPFETPYWEEEIGVGRVRQPRSTAFLTWWLVARTAALVPARAAYSTFKRYTLGEGGGERAVLEALARSAERYRALDTAAHIKSGELSPLEMFAYRIDVLELDVLKPLVVWLLEPEQEAAPAEQRDSLIAAVESWVVRRTIVRAATQGLNRFLTSQLLRGLREQPARMGELASELLAAQTAGLSAWPDDDEIRAALGEAPVYNRIRTSRLRMILEAVEDQRRGYPNGRRLSEQPVPRGTTTVEHLLPQAWRTSWDDGADAATAKERDSLLHTIGNLVLITSRLNSSISNGTWAAKRPALDASSVLLTTRDVVTAHPDSWTDDDIRERSADIADAVIAIWPVPEGHQDRAALWTSQNPAAGLAISGLVRAGLLSTDEQLVTLTDSGTEYRAALTRDGRIVVGDRSYRFPTPAATDAIGAPVDSGWTAWHVGSVDGPPLDEIREDYLRARRAGADPAQGDQVALGEAGSFKNRSITGWELDGEAHVASSWAQMYLEVLQLLHAADPQTFERMVHEGRTNCLHLDSETTLNIRRLNEYYRPLGDDLGILVWTWNDTDTKTRFLREVFGILGRDTASLVFTLRPEAPEA